MNQTKKQEKSEMALLDEVSSDLVFQQEQVKLTRGIRELRNSVIKYMPSKRMVRLAAGTFVAAISVALTDVILDTAGSILEKLEKEENQDQTIQ